MGSGSTGVRGGPHGRVRRQFDQFGREIAKFGLVGGLGTLVNFAVSNLLWHTTNLQAVRANVIATVVAIAFNYVGFRYFTYRDRDKNGRTRELTLFLVFSAVGLVIENGVLYTAIYGFDWDSSLQRNLFKVVGIGLGTLFRFWSYRTWVFRTLPVVEAVASAESILKKAEQQQRSDQRVNR
ncbi:GtrA family protein [Streptomyces yaanensis]|uniref:GtrA family protein n=1 Tax=Streptomyces yaanensis TaxID=1142239 RepID=A0ABV7S6Q4_9ACTN|nr:GtrA family protein [Streptomyces sp. CGMCC 4.7035]WNC02275.1 GtrA family protein [Streptomyces sp. CGMCC 4.7035]